ncbi:unnamed protein product [Zymoseptoria tritici ST99CH_3D1]|nr:unnamed protein product [Zymoseptoria tritici ST99CH_1E4]SMR44154.1 unnamed protein product [Zymoseptoria tritici ST99CH_3D1]
MPSARKAQLDRDRQQFKREREKFIKRKRLQKPELTALPHAQGGDIMDANWRLIKSLHDVAQVPVPSDIAQETAYGLTDLTKPEIFATACSLLGSRIPFNVAIVRHSHELLRTLQKAFQPTFVPREALLAPTHSWDIAKQVASMGSAKGWAYQPARKPGKDGKTTRAISMDEVRQTMLHDIKPVPINLLDVCNQSSHTFRPAAIAEVDLVVLIKSRYEAGTWTRSDYPQITSYDWMLLTAGPVASPFHADQAGYCTAVVGLQGEKCWYFPNGDWEFCRKMFYLHGTAFVNYPDGISVVAIGEGDCLIQGPGTPHAVVTQGKCLATGCFFYTAAFFARSIKCVRLYFEGRLDDNEVISKRDYANLGLVVDHLDRDIFTPAQRAEVYVEVGSLLLSQQKIARDVYGQMGRVNPDGTSANATAPKRGKRAKGTAPQATSSTCGNSTMTPRDRFVERCLAWWLQEHSRHLG